MRPRFADKVVLVIGGNSGIGLASAQAFAREGARVVLTGRDPATLASASEAIGSGALAIRSDITDLGSHRAVVDEVRQRYGRVDVLFANAGTGVTIAFGDATEREWDALMNTNLKGMYFMIQSVLPLMNAGSNILLTSSVMAVRGMPGLSIYSASKAAVCSLAKTLGAELVTRSIRVNVITPGPIDTPIFTRVPQPPGVLEAYRENVANSNPMKRWGKPDEVAGAVLFLASDEASYITGANLPVDGGFGNF